MIHHTRSWPRHLRSIVLCAALAGAVSHGGLRALSAQTAIQLQPLLTGLSSPLYVTSARDGTNRLFIVEQGGIIKVLRPGGTVPSVFLDIQAKVVAGGEQGLLGLTFHPNYPLNRRFFVNYTRLADGATVVAEYAASSSDPNVAAPTEKAILIVPQPFTNHNGGMLEFGPDGFLYIFTGDGGSANDPGNRAQNTTELLGKILRIDIDTPNGSVPYSSPSSNPYFGSTPGRDEIYALGLRNPWRDSFDRQTGVLYVGDVGQGAREEIDSVTLGGNYGWRVLEGTSCTGLGPGSCSDPIYVPPITEYSHTNGRCSVTGGYVYRGTLGTLPAGTYISGDYCSGEIFQLENGVSTVLLDTALNISSFGEDEAGELYVVGLGGTIDRIVSAGGAPDLTVSTLSGPKTVQAGVPVTFTDTTKNIGTSASLASTTSFYLSTDRAFDAGDTLLASRPVPPLSPNASSTAGTSATVPAGTAAGTYFLLAVADSGHSNAESNEGNNTRKRRINVS